MEPPPAIRIQAVTSRFGSVLQRLRKEAGLTQAQLAERAHVSQRGLQDLERGVHVRPHRATIDLLAAALGLSEQEHAALLAAAQAQSLPSAAVPDTLLPLVGRECELALLDRFLAAEDARGSDPRVLLLAGEPGIGKTRLLQAIAQHAIPRGWCVLFGGCQRRGGEDPYAPLPEALARYIGLQPPEALSTALVGCAWLVRLLPELAGVLEPLPAATVAPEQERRLIHAAVARLLGNVAGPSGTLLILDDLQWAGPDALDLIDTLARTSGQSQAPVRIVGAYRDTEVEAADPLGHLLADLAQARLLSRQELGPLEAADAAVLLDDLLVDMPAAGRPVLDAGGPKDEVLRRAGGMPFFLVSYAQALQQSGRSVSGFGELASSPGQSVPGSGLEEVPWDVAQGVRQRVAVLPEIARVVLGAAAVVGRRVSRDLLAAAIAQPEEAVLTGLEAACRARLLLEEGERGYIFAHDLIREVVEAEVGAARRAVLHRRVAETLELEPSSVSPELLAYHYVRAGLSDRAVRYLEMAGDHAASQYANKVAEEYYREALERADRDDDLTRLREKLGFLLNRIGKYDATLALLEPAAAAYRADGDWAGLARVTAWMGWAHAQRGTAPEGIEPIQALLHQLGRHAAAPPRGELYGALAMCLCNNGQYEEALAACECAIDLAPSADVDMTGILAEWLRIFLLILLGRLGAARQAGRETLPRTEALGDWSCLAAGHRCLAELDAVCGALDTAHEHATRSVASATALGAPAEISLALTAQGWIALLRGEWDAARTALEQAITLGRRLDGQLPAAYALIGLAGLCLAEGDRAAAAAAGEEAVALALAAGDREALRSSSTVLAELDILEGRPEAARARLVPLLDRPGMEEYLVTMILPVLAWAYLELGEVDVAAATVAQALERARREEMRLVLVDALRVQALIDLHRERWDEAERSVEEGVCIARSMPYPPAEARLLEVGERVHALRSRAQAEPASGAAGLAVP